MATNQQCPDCLLQYTSVCMYVSLHDPAGAMAAATTAVYVLVGDKFALNDGQGDDGELLTHMGRSLGASDTYQVPSS